MRLPIRARLTLTATVLMAVVLVAIGLLISVRLQSDLTRAVDAGLKSRAEQIVGALPAGERLTSPGTVIEPDEAFAQLLAPDGSILAGSVGVENSVLLVPDKAKTLKASLTYEAVVSTGTDTVPARLFAVPTARGQIVVVGASLEDQQGALNRLTALSLIGGLVALVLSALVGWVVAGNALRPVERMRSEAEAISLADPGRRLAVPETADELARLGVTLNDLLARIEATLERERRIVSDASHELRTPLANLKAEIELALRRPRGEADLRQALQSAAHETDRLIRLAKELLVLARFDQGKLQLIREPTDILALVEREVSTFVARAANHEISIRTDAPSGLVFPLDPTRVRQALANVLDNAIRHSPRGAEVSVSARQLGGELVIEVADQGVGFAVDFLEQAFEPFSRADTGRTRAEGGSGLGLAIVRAVVEAHGGSVAAASRPGGGGLVTIRIPE